MIIRIIMRIWTKASQTWCGASRLRNWRTAINLPTTSSKLTTRVDSLAMWSRIRTRSSGRNQVQPGSEVEVTLFRSANLRSLFAVHAQVLPPPMARKTFREAAKASFMEPSNRITSTVSWCSLMQWPCRPEVSWIATTIVPSAGVAANSNLMIIKIIRYRSSCHSNYIGTQLRWISKKRGRYLPHINLL